MKLRYTRQSGREFDAILDYIEVRSPQGARNVMDRIKAAADVLSQHPNAGQTRVKSAYAARLFAATRM